MITQNRWRYRGRAIFYIMTMAGAVLLALQVRAEVPPAYHPITPVMANKTITLTGRGLTIDQVIAVARYGAKVQLNAKATEHNADTFGLILTYNFLTANPASKFFPGGPPMPAGDDSKQKQKSRK